MHVGRKKSPLRSHVQVVDVSGLFVHPLWGLSEGVRDSSCNVPTSGRTYVPVVLGPTTITALK